MLPLESTHSVIPWNECMKELLEMTVSFAIVPLVRLHFVLTIGLFVSRVSR